MKNNIFYMYVYLDPRKPGNFNYGEFYFDFEPFYVGKGSKEEYLLHLRIAKNNDRRSYKVNKIRKIQSLGLEPKIIKYKENLTEEEAFDLEKRLIKAIGRFDLGTGTLTNLTDGGEGASGCTPWNKGRTKEKDPGVARQAEKMKVTMLGRTKENDPSKVIAAEKISIALKGRTAATHPYLARMAEKKRGRRLGTKEDTPWIAKMAEKKRGRTKENDPSVARTALKLIVTTAAKRLEVRQKISKALIGRIPWNKGLTKEKDARVASQAITMRKNTNTRKRHTTCIQTPTN